MRPAIFTIGHSTHTIEQFLALLKQHGITALCDLRSKPYSRFNPQFNREHLKQQLSESGIAYVFLGMELGARSENPSCYDHGKVQYDLLARTDLFQKGLGQVQEESREHRMALMCAEKDPLECHRTILVARHLDAMGLAVQHILADGSLESHADALKRLVGQLKLAGPDMFRSHDDVVGDAYRIQGERIAYGSADIVPTDANVRSAAG